MVIFLLSVSRIWPVLAFCHIEFQLISEQFYWLCRYGVNVLQLQHFECLQKWNILIIRFLFCCPFNASLASEKYNRKKLVEALDFVSGVTALQSNPKSWYNDGIKITGHRASLFFLLLCSVLVTWIPFTAPRPPTVSAQIPQQICTSCSSCREGQLLAEFSSVIRCL